MFVITKADWGGAQRYVFDLATSLPRDRYQPVVALGPAGRPSATIGRTLDERLAAAGVPVRVLGSLQRDLSTFSDLRAVRDLAAAMRAEAPDIVHLNSSKAAGLGALAARLAGVPRTVYTVHGWPFLEPRGGLQRATILAASYLSCLLVDCVILVSRHDLRLAQGWPIVGRRMRHVLYGLRLPELLLPAEARDALRARLGTERLPPPGPWVGVIAELHRNKGLADLVKAFASVAVRFENASLLLVGEGEERAALSSEIRRTGLEGRVWLCGFVDEASRYLSAFDVLALPSLKEGLPYALLEGAAAGLPIVATRVGGIPEILENGRSAWLVEPGRPQELAAALTDLLSAPERREAFGRSARDAVREGDAAGMLTATLRIYEDGPI